MGAFLFAPLVQWLLSIMDWQNALLVLAGLSLICALYGALMRPLTVDIAEDVFADEEMVTNVALLTEPIKDEQNHIVNTREIQPKFR